MTQHDGFSTATVDGDRRRRLLVLAICCASVIAVVMDISIVNVALPAIRHDLDATASGLQWTVDAYTLVLASFLVLAGSMADRFGRRRVFLVGLTVFGVGSLCCGLAPSMGWLIGARALQAVGGTMLNPVALAIVANTFTDAAERARAIGVIGSMTGLSLAVGPVLGGLLVNTVGWRAVFLVNVPIVIAAVVCARLFIPESRAARARKFDPVGQALVALFLGSVIYVVIESRSLGWDSLATVGLLAAAVISLLGIVIYEPRRNDPLLELRLFRSLPFSGAILMALLALCGFQAFLFVTTLYLQNVRGMSAAAAGLCLAPIGVLVVVLSPVSGRLVGSGGPLRPLLIAGAALAAAGGASQWVAAKTPLILVLPIYILIGIFLSMVNPPITNTAVSGMPRSMAGVAGALASTGRQTGTALGVAIAGVIIGPALTRGDLAYIAAAHHVWGIVSALGVGLVLLAFFSTGSRAKSTAVAAAARFSQLDRGPATAPPRPAPGGPGHPFRGGKCQ